MGKKLKVVLDTNVWVSIFMKKTLGEEFSGLLEKDKMDVYISRQILEEISKVLVYPKITELLELSGVSVKQILQNVVKSSKPVNPKVKLDLIKEDVEDNRILECALEAGADFIVSGDGHLLKLRKFKGVKIIKPREFLNIILS